MERPDPQLLVEVVHQRKQLLHLLLPERAKFSWSALTERLRTTELLHRCMLLTESAVPAPEQRDDVSELERRRCEQLAERGFDLVDEGECEEALAVADELAKHRYTANFEIRALALAKLDRKEEAVDALEEGVEKAPSVWRLWQLLGNYRSDLGEMDNAHDAYVKALECPDVDTSSVHLNRAVAFSRQERYEDARAVLSLVTDPARRVRREALSVGFLIDTGRFPEAVRQAQGLLEQEWDEEDDGVRAWVQADLARALHKMGASPDRVREETWRALELDKRCESALWLLREVDSNFSPNANYYRLLLGGQVPDNCDELPAGDWVYVNYEVVAESPEEALTLAARLEPASLRPALRVEEWEVVEPRPDDPKGVYWMSAYHLAPGDAEE